MIGGAAHHGARHGAEAGLAEAVLAPAGEFHRHLVAHRRAARPFHRRGIGQAERQQHRLLEPLIDLPALVAVGSATRTAPESSASSAASTASRAAPPVAEDSESRCSQSSSIGCCSGMLAHAVTSFVVITGWGRCRPDQAQASVACQRGTGNASLAPMVSNGGLVPDSDNASCMRVDTIAGQARGSLGPGAEANLARRPAR